MIRIYYYCIINNNGSNCNVTSSPTLISVTPIPLIVTQPNNQAICIGGVLNPLFTGITGGNGNPTYQWYLNNAYNTTSGTPISGATNSTYTPTVSSNPGSYYYYCKINFSTGNCTNLISDIALIYVNTATIAGVLNSSQTICQNNLPTLLSITGSNGTNFTWQYSSNNSTWNTILNSNNDTLLPSQMSVINFNQNYYFRVLVNNSICASQLTNTILISVLSSPVGGIINSSNQTICYGTNPSTLTLSGSSGTIQWERSTSMAGPWTLISGANATSLSGTTIGALTQTTYFRVKVSNVNCGITYSTISTVSVTPQAIAGIVSSNDTICYNTSPPLISVVGYVGTLQWQISADNINWTNISGATSNTLTGLSPLASNRYFRVIVTNGNCLPVFSNSILITVSSNSSVGFVNSSQTICQGSIPANLTLSSNIGTIIWQYSTSNNANTFQDIAGQNYLSLFGSAIGALSNSTYFRVKVTNGPCASVYSNSILITVIGAPSGGVISNNQTICSNTYPSTITSNSTFGNLQWQYATNLAGPWVNISGATSSSLTSAQMGILTSTRHYRIAATNGICPTAYSNIVSKTVSSPGSVGSIGTNQNICIGNQPTNVTLSTYNGSIQWQYATTSTGTYTNIGNGSNPLTGNQIGVINNTIYIRAQVSGCTTVTSSILTINALPTPTISAGFDDSVCLGDEIALSGSGGSNYQWSNNVINGQLFAPQSTTTYTLVGFGPNGCSNTDNVVITVLPLPNVSLQYNSQTNICQGNSFTITANAASNLTYQWFKNNILIAGATNNSIQVTQQGSYKVKITSSVTGCQTYSNSVNVNVLPVPTLTIVGNTNICFGDTASFSATSSGNVVWNGNLNQSTLQLTPSTNTPFYVVSTGTNGCTSTFYDTIIVHNATDTSINMSSYGPINLNGYNYDQSGVYIQNLSSIYGCDSTVTINLNVNFNLINETENSQISIVNPINNGILTFYKNNIVNFSLISIIDITGREINFELVNSSDSINEYHIYANKGVYIVVFEIDGLKYAKQVYN